MSFYTGRHRQADNTYKRQLHITKGQHSLSQMQGAPFSATVFHSDIRYLDYKIFDLTTYYNTKIGYYSSPSGTIQAKNTKTYLVPEDVRKYIFDNDYAFTIYNKSAQNVYKNYDGLSCIAWFENGDCNMGAHTEYSVNGVMWAKNHNNIFMSNDSSCNAGYKTHLGRQTPYLVVPAGSSAISIIVWGIKNSGAFAPLYPQDRKGNIFIDRTHFKVGNYDVLNCKYVTMNKINSQDYVIHQEFSSNMLQLINSKLPSSSSLEFGSNQNETYIKKGSYKIITSNLNNTGINVATVYTGNTPYQYFQPSGSQNSWSKTYDQKILSHKFTNNQVFFVTIKYGKVSNDDSYMNNVSIGGRRSASYVCEYKSGNIVIISGFHTDTTLSDIHTVSDQKEHLYGSGGYLYLRTIISHYDNNDNASRRYHISEKEYKIILLT